jgi:MFS family permease
VLRIAEFRALFLAELLSVAGDQVARIAVALLVYGRTRSAFLASATYAASYLTELVTGPVLATLADRCPKRGLMISCDVARAAVACVLLLPGVPVPAVFGVLVALAALSSPFEAARSALLPDVLGDDAYPVGNALQNSVFTAGTVVGFAAGGALVAGVGMRGALLVDVLSFAASGLVIAVSVRTRATGADERQTASLWAETVAGWRLIRRQSQLMWLLAVASIGAVVAVNTQGLAAPTAAAVGGGAVAVGILSAAVPAGYLLGAYLLTHRPASEGARGLLPLLAAASAPLLLSPALTTPWALAALWAVTGVGSALQVVANAQFVLGVPPQMRGRAFGVAMAVLMGGQGLALLLAGALADTIDPRWVVAGFGGAGLATVPFLARWSPAQARRPQGRHTSRRGHA